MKGFLKKKRRTLYFSDAARFNWALDTDQQLQDGMAKLNEQFPDITEEAYIVKLLELFQCAGLEISREELKMLLVLRRETDRMLL